MMMRAFFVVAVAGSVWGTTPLTLDPAVMEEAKRAVFERGSAAEAADAAAAQPAAAPVAVQWQAAMDAAGTELLPVQLLALLQQLNPHLPMQEHPALYAEALRLHVLAAAGNKQARGVLALALETGVLPGGLHFLQDLRLAAKWRAGI